MKGRYIRVSTSGQNTARQEERQSQDEKLYIDVVSGSIPFSERIKGKELFNDIINSNINYVSVSSIDRLGRNLYDILTTLEFFNKQGVILKVDNLGIESLINGQENSAFKLIISVLGTISEMERDTMICRIKEGVAIAKLQGKYTGREKGTIESDDVFLSKYKEVIKNLKKGNSIRDTAKICNTSIGTVQKVKGKIQLF